VNRLSAPAQAIVSAEAVTKVYQRGREQVRAVDRVSFEIFPSEFVAITGPSGAGKTTLLNLIGSMESPSSGSLKLLGSPLQGLTERGRTRVRREQIGFVFQHFSLLPTLTVEENIALPGFFARRPAPDRVRELVARVGLEHRRRHRPRELSGGEMQRAAIARALVNRPAVLLADEPTGNLDSAMGESIIELFRELNREGLTIIVVTHNPALARSSHRELEMTDGRLRTGSERARLLGPSHSAAPSSAPMVQVSAKVITMTEL
jgi:ABC-type lipoprotein export system ATPase subunit